MMLKMRLEEKEMMSKYKKEKGIIEKRCRKKTRFSLEHTGLGSEEEEMTEKMAKGGVEEGAEVVVVLPCLAPVAKCHLCLVCPMFQEISGPPPSLAWRDFPPPLAWVNFHQGSRRTLLQDSRLASSQVLFLVI